MVSCPTCGAQSTEGQRFCVVCGSALPVAPNSPLPPGVAPAPEVQGAVSASPSWTPAPPLSGEQLAQGPSSDVLLGFAAMPPVQSRLTILFRIILAIPLLVWVGVLSIASGFCVFISWFAALFTGRVPAGLQEFNTDVLRYTTEVNAYVHVLVARWPGFTLQPGSTQQVSLQIQQFKLNRAAVFFRYFLSLPAMVVLFLVSFGSYALTLAVWISAMILGRPAKPLYQASLLCMRYNTRFSAYLFMLSPTQPFAGLFGDGGLPDVLAPGDATPVLSTRIYASKWARTFLVLSLVVGLVVGAFDVKRLSNVKNVIDTAIVIPVVTSTRQNVVKLTTAYGTTMNNQCIPQSSAACGVLAAVTARDAIATQLAALRAIEGLTSRGRSQYLAYEAALGKVSADFSHLAAVSNLTQQRTYVTSVLKVDVIAFSVAYENVRAAL